MSEVAARPGARGTRLFLQIALRLILVAVLFAALEVLIVVAMYARDRDTLGQSLLTLEAEHIARALKQHPDAPLLAQSPDRALAVYDEHGHRLLTENPGRLPLPEVTPADLHTASTREVRGERFFLTGVRRVAVDGQPRWIALAIAGQGLEPLLPALFREVLDHALLPMIPLSLLLLVFNVAVVRRMLAPLERAMRQADALDPDHAGLRLQLPDSPVEVRSLLSAMNRALDRLERAMNTLRRFTADVAHELRTPLAAMTLTLERLPACPEREQLRADAAGMSRLIGQMLDLARAESSVDMRSARTGLDVLATRVVAELTPLAVSRNRLIRYHCRGDSEVAGQPELLARALRNLVENALMHAPAGTVVEVCTGPGAQIVVRDHGPGIAPQIRERVFERFWRGRSGGGTGGGTGLGLAITRSIMDACGGRVEIDDAPGGGARVRLVFPD